MREQLQERFDQIKDFARKPLPKNGWIRTLRDALGLSSYALAKKLGCKAANVLSMEQREKRGNIQLETLETVAQAMNCRLVYYFIPHESLDKILENQARLIAQKKIQHVNKSMKLEAQGLTIKQLKQQEDELVQKLLHGNLRDLWNDDEI